jgi:S1-C subfamily serine protease
VKLDGVTTGSPADKAGFQKGDIIVRIGETEIEDLETFSDVLKTLQAGTEITVVFMRHNTEYSVTTKVVTR